MTRQLTITPTLNSIPLRHGDFSTTTDALEYASRGKTGFNFFNASGELTSVLSYARLQQESIKTGLYLKQKGFARYDRLALVAETTPEFLILFFACQYAGLIPCPVAFSLHPGGMSVCLEKLRLLSDRARIKMVICSSEIANVLKNGLPVPLLVSERVIEEAPPLKHSKEHTLSPLNAEDPAYVQFSSGSTNHPRGVLLGQRHLEANIHAVLRDGMQLRPEDRSFSWLPLHHNMGLVGFMLASVYGQRSVDCLSAEHFVQNPLIWPELMSRNKTCITFSPSFGYQLTAQKYSEKKEKPHLDLSALRITGIGGDAVSTEILESFSACFASSGFKAHTFLPCYGMTETTLAVTVSMPGTPVVVDYPDGNKNKPLISCGRALPGFVIKIVDPENAQELSERQTGQIWVKGPSVVASYTDKNERIAFDNDGFMYTGDLGYLSKGLLYITGREKDIIIIRGRNIWAQDIEMITARSLPRTGAGNTVAIRLNNGLQEHLAVLVTISHATAQDKSALHQNAQVIKKAVARETGIDTEVIFITDPLPLTPSGKLARQQIRDRYLACQFTVIPYDEEPH